MSFGPAAIVASNWRIFSQIPCNLTFIGWIRLGRKLFRFSSVGIGSAFGHDRLEERLIGVQKLGDRLEVDNHSLANHALGGQWSRSRLDRPIERHRTGKYLLQQIHCAARTVVALEHLSTKYHPRNLDLSRERNLVPAGQQRDLAHLGQVHADRIVDPSGELALDELLLDELLFFGGLFLLFSDLLLLFRHVFFEIVAFAGTMSAGVGFVHETDPHLVERAKELFETARTDQIVGQRVVHFLVGEVPFLAALRDQRSDHLFGVLRLRCFRRWIDLRLTHIHRFLRFPFFLRHNIDPTEAKKCRDLKIIVMDSFARAVALAKGLCSFVFTATYF